MTRRALLAQLRHPTPDRDGGSSRTLDLAAALQGMGFDVTFCAISAEEGWERYGRLLEQAGIDVRNGVPAVIDDLRDGVFEIAAMTLWRTAEQLVPLIAECSPRTAIVVHSSDLHFLRLARRAAVAGCRIGAEVGDEFQRELNSYLLADRVVMVSTDEARLVAQFVGNAERFVAAPLSEPACDPPLPIHERRGLLFVGNFRHVPNIEAAQYLCDVVLPQVSPKLLAAHPLTVVGNALCTPGYGEVRAAVTRFPGVRAVGWVPDVDPYVRRARLSVAPLLHGAGVKGKILQSLNAGTPVVTTPVGMEGLAPSIVEAVTVADGAFALAAAIEHLLTDDARWKAASGAGPPSVGAIHARPVVVQRLAEVITEALVVAAQRQNESELPVGFAAGAHREWERSHRAVVAGFAHAVGAVTPSGAEVVVISGGDDRLLAIPGRAARHFPESAQGGHAGSHPVDGAAALAHLRALVATGARYLAVPATSLYWLHHYPQLAAFLEESCCILRSELGRAYQLRPVAHDELRHPEGSARQAPRRTSRRSNAKRTN